MGSEPQGNQGQSLMVITPELLRSFPVLSPLTDTVLNQLAQHSSHKKLARRAIVLNAGVREDSLCFLFEGRLQGVDFTIDGREVGLYFVEPGDFCGELGLFDDGPQPEYVIALAPSAVVMVPVEHLRNVMLAATALGVAGLALLDESAPGALTRVWLVAGAWIGVRAAFGMARIWPGIGASPFRS